MYVIKLPYNNMYVLDARLDTEDITKAKQFKTKDQARAFRDIKCPKGCKIIPTKKGEH